MLTMHEATIDRAWNVQGDASRMLHAHRALMTDTTHRACSVARSLAGLWLARTNAESAPASGGEAEERTQTPQTTA